MPIELTLVLFVIIGFLSGLLGGLLGIGGGVVTVPFLYYFYRYTGEHPEKLMQVAACTSLAVAFVTAGMSTYYHLRHKSIDFSILKWMFPFLMIGCVVGAFIAEHVATEILSHIFATAAAILGIYFFFPKLPHLHIASKPNASLSLFALAIGSLSSMLGIGGGIVTFPILLGYHVPVLQASSTSSAATWISTGTGTVAFLIIVWAFPGYIDLMAWTALSIGSIVTTKIGVKLARILDIRLIKRIFGGCLVLIALSMYLL